jgi:hypothetical protein
VCFRLPQIEFYVQTFLREERENPTQLLQDNITRQHREAEDNVPKDEVERDNHGQLRNQAKEEDYLP